MTTEITEAGPDVIRHVGKTGQLGQAGQFGEAGGSGGLRISRVPNSEPPPRGLEVVAVSCDGGGTGVVAPQGVPVRAPMRHAEPVDVGLRQFAIAATTVILEVMGGRRPFAHLAGVALPHIADQFQVLLADQVRGQACTLMRLHTQHTRPDVAEITVVYRRGDRVHAMGARVERRMMRVRPVVPGGPRRREQRCVLVSVSVG